MIASRNRALDDAVVLAAAALLVCSFLPWTADHGHRTTGAWQGSVVWPVVVCCALGAALVWLVARRHAVRAAAAVVALGAGVCALAYATVESVSRVEPAGYVGIGMIVSLAVVIAGDGLRGRSSTTQVLLGVGGGVLLALCALPWAVGSSGFNSSLWHASAVWTVTVAVVLAAVAAVLIRDSRSTRLIAALPAAVAAGWALAFTVTQPNHVAPQADFARSTVAIAKFTAGPRLVSERFHFFGVLEYAVVGCAVMVALAVVLAAAVPSAVRTASARER